MLFVPISAGSTEVRKIGLKYEQLLSQMGGLRGKTFLKIFSNLPQNTSNS